MDSYELFLNGTWQDSGNHLKVLDPSTGLPFAKVATVEREAVRQAIEDAEAAFSGWRELTALARSEYLLAIAEELGKRADKVARLITMENGKPLNQAAGEVAMSIDHLKWFAEESRRAYGRQVPHQADGKRHIIIRQPVGVVGAIAPWNFPLVLALRKVAPALAAGCPVVLKPASATPLSAIELARCVDAVGLIVGAAQTCTELSLELGGNAPLIIFADADFNQAVEGALITKFRNNGQSCIASNRIYVQRPIYERFISTLTDKLKDLKVGNGLEPDVDIGPLIDDKAFATALSFVEDAVSKGARVLTGGTRFGDKGNFVTPTLLVDIPEDATCRHEEIFAPIAAVYVFDEEEEVLEKANDTEFGLAAYAYTTDLNRALRVSEALEAGTVGINDPVPSTSNCPFGGFKQSGWGRELGSEGIDAYLETKHICIGGVG